VYKAIATAVSIAASQETLVRNVTVKQSHLLDPSKEKLSFVPGKNIGRNNMASVAEFLA
jgi:hypothetical protein